MSYTLLIVESPAKCGKIEKYLGSGYKCLASFGHICELNGLENIDLENNFKPNFTLMDGKRQQVSKLRTAISKANEVILATDDDREGEAIAWHICNVFKLSVAKTKRIVFHEVTERAIKDAVKRPGFINMNPGENAFGATSLTSIPTYITAGCAAPPHPSSGPAGPLPVEFRAPARRVSA